jgi:hypothetical protein
MSSLFDTTGSKDTQAFRREQQIKIPQHEAFEYLAPKKDPVVKRIALKIEETITSQVIWTLKQCVPQPNPDGMKISSDNEEEVELTFTTDEET